MEVSRTLRSIPTEVPLGKREGLPQRCAVNADNLVTIPKAWLDSRIARLSDEKVEALDHALRFALGLPD
jgi:mRNA interferase MazF